MADIKMLLQNYATQDDDQGDEEDYSKYYESSMIDQTNPDELLTPLEKLKKYCTNENIFTRQMVARSIVETVQSISNEQECLSLLEIITKLSDDIEPSVRCELMEQLPPCSMMMMDMKIIPDAISTFILPVMVKYLTDTNNQVRKLSQNALLQLMDQDLIKKEDVVSQICPVILSLTESESNDDFRTEAVALMTKISMVLGDELTERFFLQRFGKLCSDALFHVRKGCASNFGEIASVVRRETVEMHLLPLFARLCEDGVWGVRKACAETFVAISEICSKTVRYQTLSPLFVGLLCDQSRWVQMAAYQDLGQFIATFAEPERTGFQVNGEGVLMPFVASLNVTYDCKREAGSPSPFVEDPSLESDRQASLGSSESNESVVLVENSIISKPSPDETSKTFNNFEYWRTPLPNVDLANELIDASIDSHDNSQHSNTSDKCKSLIEPNESTLDVDDTSSVTENLYIEKGESVKTYVIIDSSKEGSCEENMNFGDDEIANAVRSICEDVANDCDKTCPSERIHIENLSDDNLGKTFDETDNRSHETSIEKETSQDDVFEPLNDFCSLFCSDDENTEDKTSTLPYDSHYASNVMFNENLYNQSIVPPALLEHFISMINPDKNKTIDGDLPRHCAFTLPGVVLALGRENWDLLRDTYVTLSTDMQWKVRRTLAFSIHDLAQILGERICIDDLVNVFNQFLKDLDEVRVGVLKHLFNFINLLPKKQQKDYLPLFCEFQKTDNYRNWRFRKDLAEQLISLVELYDEEEVSEYLCPVALELASDKVADVRENAYNLLSILLHKLYDNEDPHLYHKFVASVITLGTHHQHWVKRKANAQIYCKFLEMNWYDKAHFARDFLPSLLNLCADVVPNVRLISSKALLAISKCEYYQCLPEADEVRKQVDHTLETLQFDEDRDVRFFSGGKVKESDDDTIPLDEDGDARYYSDADVEDKLSKMTLEMALDSDSDSFSHPQDGIRIVQHEILEYPANDNGSGETEIIEEVYIEEPLQNTSGDGDVIMEELYIEQPNVDISTGGEPQQSYYVEEIIEEIIETDS